MIQITVANLLNIKDNQGTILSWNAKQHWLACALHCRTLAAFLICFGGSWLQEAQKEIQGMSKQLSSVDNQGGCWSLWSGPICLEAQT